jgi:hypothetical protein
MLTMHRVRIYVLSHRDLKIKLHKPTVSALLIEVVYSTTDLLILSQKPDSGSTKEVTNICLFISDANAFMISWIRVGIVIISLPFVFEAFDDEYSRRMRFESVMAGICNRADTEGIMMRLSRTYAAGCMLSFLYQCTIPKRNKFRYFGSR